MFHPKVKVPQRQRLYFSHLSLPMLPHAAPNTMFSLNDRLNGHMKRGMGAGIVQIGLRGEISMNARRLP